MFLEALGVSLASLLLRFPEGPRAPWLGPLLQLKAKVGRALPTLRHFDLFLGLSLDLPGQSEIISYLKAFNLTPPVVRGAMREQMLTGSGDKGRTSRGDCHPSAKECRVVVGGVYWGRDDLLYLMIIYY